MSSIFHTHILKRWSCKFSSWVYTDLANVSAGNVCNLDGQKRVHWYDKTQMGECDHIHYEQ